MRRSAALVLLALSGAPASAEEFCVTVESAAQTPTYAVADGDLLEIAFTHSIYGSQVEERFEINRASFESIDVRYSEPRLVDFYGYESATRAGDWWVVRPATRHHRILIVRASQDSPIRVRFRNHTFLLKDAAARISLGVCSPRLFIPR
ncbi:MAG TPA: hypothetical protein VHM64_12330, partial [Candidatus Binatia bacterium]|nr:hypothetical protein [Candidatus Binatia bacterium]